MQREWSERNRLVKRLFLTTQKPSLTTRKIIERAKRVGLIETRDAGYLVVGSPGSTVMVFRISTVYSTDGRLPAMNLLARQLLDKRTLDLARFGGGSP